MDLDRRATTAGYHGRARLAAAVPEVSEVYPVLIGPLHTFGVMVLLGVLAGLWWVRRDAPRLRLDPEDVASLAVEVFLAGLIGSRIQFVIHNWEHYADAPWKVVAIWQGGLVWYGGLIAAIPVAIWRMKHYGFPILRTCDLLAPSTMLGLAIGRIGCLFAGDDHGRIILLESELQSFLATKPPGWFELHRPVVMDHIPWYALTFTDERALVGPGYLDLPLLPSQPLMTIGCLAVFGILAALRKPLMKAPGTIAALLFVLYPIHRFLVEYTRGDLVRGYYEVPVLGGMATSQLLSLLILPFGVAAAVFFYVRGRREWDRLVAEGKDPLALERRPSLEPGPAAPASPAPAPAAPSPAPATEAAGPGGDAPAARADDATPPAAEPAPEPGKEPPA